MPWSGRDHDVVEDAEVEAGWIDVVADHGRLRAVHLRDELVQVERVGVVVVDEQGPHAGIVTCPAGAPERAGAPGKVLSRMLVTAAQVFLIAERKADQVTELKVSVPPSRFLVSRTPVHVEATDNSTQKL